MSRTDDLRKTIEAAIGSLTPARAQQLAKRLLEPDARKDQVTKTATDILEWSQKNRERIRDLVRGEIREQLRASGAATQSELDALKKRVREIERATGMTASGRKKTTAKGAPSARKPTSSKGARGAAGSAAKRTGTTAGGASANGDLGN